MAAIDPRAIQSQAYGRYNRVIEYNNPGVQGFLSRPDGGPTDPVFITVASGIDGPYAAKNRDGVLYGNIDWRGLVGANTRIISWDGPTFRYTNGFLPSGSLIIGDTPAPLYERGRLIATTPLPIVGAALKSIALVEWIRVICWQPSTEEWVAFEKIRDGEPQNSTNWTEVARVAWSTVSEPEPVVGDLRKQNQFEMAAFFNSTATKAIGTWIAFITNAASATRFPATILMDFDWPSASGGPVIISSVPAQTVDQNSIVVSSTPGSIQYTSTLSGSPVLARDFDENDNEIEYTVTGSGTLSVLQVVASSIETLTVSSTQRRLMDDGNGHTLLTQGTNLITGATKSTDLGGGGGTPTGSGTFEGFLASVAGFDLRSKFFGGYEEHATQVVSGSGTLLDTVDDRDFDYTSFFPSSLGTINHVSEAKPTVNGTIAHATYLVSFFAGIPNNGLNFAIDYFPRDTITGRIAGGGQFRGGNAGPNQGNMNDYKFDSFGNDFAFADYSLTVFFDGSETNPALPDENFLSGASFQALHGVAFNAADIGIA